MEELKYPIGKFQRPLKYGPKKLKEFISVIEKFPSKIKSTVETMSDEQLDTPYRPGGWSSRQVVNHCADSHMNGLIRLKLALTEDTPIIKPYLEDRWAELEDGKNMPLAPAFMTIEGVHRRWVVLLKGMVASDWERGFMHPEKGRRLSLAENTGMYAWHCEHHLAHITRLKGRMGWK